MQSIVADLHIHSVFSDGLDTPESICDAVAASGLKLFSLTDHDSVKGHAVCRQYDGVSFIPGIELTATTNGREVHILGYFVKTEFPELLETLENIAVRRKERLFGIIDKVNGASGMGIDRDEVERYIGAGSYNRLTLARFMTGKGMVPNLEYCFTYFLGDRSDYYEAVNYFTPPEAINLIHRAGGTAFLAHPYANKTADLIPELVEQGLDGIEAFHPSHGSGEVRRCLDWAERFRLAVSGGSDYHGVEGSSRKLLSAGLNGERLVDFLAFHRPKDCAKV